MGSSSLTNATRSLLDPPPASANPLCGAYVAYVAILLDGYVLLSAAASLGCHVVDGVQ